MLLTKAERAAINERYARQHIDPSGKGIKNYLEVKYRLMMLHELDETPTVTTKVLHWGNVTGTETRTMNGRNGPYQKTFPIGGYAVVHATVTTAWGAHGEGVKSETSEDFGDYLEKAETGAIGRALAAAGIGTQYAGHDYEYEATVTHQPYVGVDSAPDTIAQAESTVIAQPAPTVAEPAVAQKLDLPPATVDARNHPQHPDRPPTLDPAYAMRLRLAYDTGDKAQLGAAFQQIMGELRKAKIAATPEFLALNQQLLNALKGSTP